MHIRKPIRFRKLSTESVPLHYIHHYSDLPRDLSGNEMEKERFLNFLTAKMLDTVSIQPRRR